MRPPTVLSTILLTLVALGHLLPAPQVATAATNFNELYAQTKQAGFRDPNTGYLYRVTSYNATKTTAETKHRSIIKVSRIKLSANDQPLGEPENVLSLTFYPTLVDFDLHCLPTHCYLVAVTSRPHRNVELYKWYRTQFDLVAKRDSYARPTGVKLFRIQSSFYIAIAQEQLHLSPNKLSQNLDEPTRFVGCAILKFIKGQEQNIKYHQFIKLPFNPSFVNYFISVSNPNIPAGHPAFKPKSNHLITFSVYPEFVENAGASLTLIWSPLDEYFWPYRLPRGATLGPGPAPTVPVLNYPDQYEHLNLNQTRLPPSEHIDPVESCFHQLQRLVSDRELLARKLIQSSESLWRSPNVNLPSAMTNISAQVIVRGNVIVRGSLIQSPQISLLSHPLQQAPNIINVQRIASLVNTHSPAIVENKLSQAFYKLKYIRNKLNRAIPANTPVLGDFANGLYQFDSRIRFFGNIFANRVVFKHGGIANSNMRLNDIPFRQLANELVSLSGQQDITARIIFRGNVVADLLEIHGTINGQHLLKDAVDITSKFVQVVDTTSYLAGRAPGSMALDFRSISAPDVILAPNATLNAIRLDDFITTTNQTQIIVGRKSFKQLAMNRLDMAHANVQLNGYNVSRIALNSVRVNQKQPRYFSGDHVTFTRPITVDKLILNGLINRHINITTFIHESVKVNDAIPQQIFGYKQFQQGLSINQLTTDGFVNGIQIDQVFNTNPAPPTSDYNRTSSYQSARAQITGQFVFTSPATISGNLEASLINNINITRHAIRRQARGSDQLINNASLSSPQIINGRKIFSKPVRVINRIKLLEPNQYEQFGINSATQPLINGLDIRKISTGIAQQMQNPAVIYVENLEIDGNLNLNVGRNQINSSRVSLGNFTTCPLDAIRKQLVLGGPEDQIVEGPIRIGQVRAKSIHLSAPAALNGLSFPDDFVLKSTGIDGSMQQVFGHKSFENLIVVPSLAMPVSRGPLLQAPLGAAQTPVAASLHRSPLNVIVVGSNSIINNITYHELQTFIMQERQRNSSGETVLQTLDVFGNIYAQTIEGNNWPEDILLKSVSSQPGPPMSPYLHRRVYAPIIFTKPTDLIVEDLLALRGPIQLNGRLNGVNLTEFSRQSVTYGDKDLLSVAKPIRNKVFAGGLTVSGEMRAQGRIEGVNVDEMRNRVVTIEPNPRKTIITGPKIFMSDVSLLAPTSIMYLNNLPLYQFTKRMQNQPKLGWIRIYGKKTISGALKINRVLFVEGLINGYNFVELQARAISLSSKTKAVQFNQTLTIDGDVFLDNLLIDEKDGIIDGVKLANLVPVEQTNLNELVISQPVLMRPNSSLLGLQGHVQDCQISCSLVPNQRPPLVQPMLLPLRQQQSPVQLPQPQAVVYPSRPIIHLGQNVSYMRSTPPYTMAAANLQYPLPTPAPRYLQMPQQVASNLGQPQPGLQLQALVNRLPSMLVRRPASIRFEVPNRLERLGPNGQRMPIQLGKQQLDFIRHEMVALQLIQSTHNILIGFIESLTNDLAGLHLPDKSVYDPMLHRSNLTRSFRQLDQTEFLFKPSSQNNYTTIYELLVGITPDPFGQNITSVFSSVNGGELRQVSVLPIQDARSAMFLQFTGQNALMLLVSEDPPQVSRGQCPIFKHQLTSGIVDYNYPTGQTRHSMGGVHLYLFMALQNSTSPTSAFFDLYQTIDLQAIDGFDSFTHLGSTYVLATSKQANRVYLLIFRGYLGLEIVSYFDVPMLESIKIFFTQDERPSLIVYQTNGHHKLMEAVVI